MKHKALLIGLSFLLIVISDFTYANPVCIPIPAVEQDVQLTDRLALVKRNFKMRRIESINDNEEAITNTAEKCSSCSKATFNYLEAKVPYRETKAILEGPAEAPQTFEQVVDNIQNTLDNKHISYRHGMSREDALAFLDSEKLQPGRSALVGVVLDTEGDASDVRHMFLVLKGTSRENPSYSVIEMRGRARFDAAKKIDLRNTLNSTNGFWYKYIENGVTHRFHIKNDDISVMFVERPLNT